MSYYVYFIIQRKLGYRFSDLKVGHSLNPRKRAYSYRDSQTEATIIHAIEFSEKKLALAVERGYVRILKGLDKYPYSDAREWFRLTTEISNQLDRWGIAHEKSNIQDYN